MMMMMSLTNAGVSKKQESEKEEDQISYLEETAVAMKEALATVAVPDVLLCFPLLSLFDRCAAWIHVVVEVAEAWDANRNVVQHV